MIVKRPNRIRTASRPEARDDWVWTFILIRLGMIVIASFRNCTYFASTRPVCEPLGVPLSTLIVRYERSFRK